MAWYASDTVGAGKDHNDLRDFEAAYSDGDDLSTTELLQRVSKALDRSARLLPVPAWIISLAATLFGKRDVSQRLLGSLQVDISKTRDLLGWVPPVSVDEALKKTAQSFLLKK